MINRTHNSTGVHRNSLMWTSFISKTTLILTLS